MIYITQELIELSKAGSVVPLKNSRVCYDTLTRDPNNLSSNGSVTDFEVTNLTNGFTNETFKIGTNSSDEFIEVQNPDNDPVNYIGIAAHTLFSRGEDMDITLQGYDGTNYIDIVTLTPEDDRPILILFGSSNFDSYKINLNFSGTLSTAPTIGVVYVGQALEMQRSTFGGHAPLWLNKGAKVLPMESDNGNYIGRSVIRNQASSNVSFKNISSEWAENNLYQLQDAINRYPFFFAFSAEPISGIEGFLSMNFADQQYSLRGAKRGRHDAASFCWLKPGSTLSASYQGVRDLMQISFPIESYVNE